MGHKYTRDEILTAAVQTALSHGLSRLTYGLVARHAGTSDRVVAYYFPTTAELAAAVLTTLGAELEQTLGATGIAPVPDHVALLNAVWSLVARPDVDPVFGLYFEAVGLAAAQREPYATQVPLLVEGWIAWAVTCLEGTAEHRRAEAESAIAVIDGLLLLRRLAGPAVADRAARQLGVSSQR